MSPYDLVIIFYNTSSSMIHSQTYWARYHGHIIFKNNIVKYES